jgi:HlyD family secretion protein
MIDLLCSIPLLASLFASCTTPLPLAVGYVEGEYVLIAPIETNRITKILVKRGERITQNQNLAVLEKRDVEIQITEAKASLAQAKGQLANLQQGKRPAEIAVIEASLDSAIAQATEAERIEKRQGLLLIKGITTKANFDDASTKFELARTKVVEIEATLTAARLPARPNEIKAASAQVARAGAVVENANWRLSQRSLSYSASATVFDIIRNSGEVAGPQAPVLSILPDGAVKLRLYVPEISLATISPGSTLTVRCDSCSEDLKASVSYISNEPEFTPPVIYSLENRQKLVYLIEAVPIGETRKLKPGQIVDVVLELTGTTGQ